MALAMRKRAALPRILESGIGVRNSPFFFRLAQRISACEQEGPAERSNRRDTMSAAREFTGSHLLAQGIVRVDRTAPTDGTCHAID
jgi:hypothetical protein